VRFAEQKSVFDSWLSAYQGVLFKVVRAYAFTRHDQEDLFQEIAAQVWISVPASKAIPLRRPGSIALR
jgi:RNA polymerase sigma-70 factor (ECF subfamily)